MSGGHRRVASWVTGWNLRAWISLLVVVATGPALALALVVGLAGRQLAERAFSSRAGLVAYLTAHEYSEINAAAGSVLEDLARSPAAWAPGEGCDQLLRALLSRDARLRALGVLTERAPICTSSRAERGRVARFDPSRLPSLAPVRVELESDTGLPLFTFVRTAYGPGGRVVLLVARISIGSPELASAIALPPGSRVELWTRRGDTLTRYPVESAAHLTDVARGTRLLESVRRPAPFTEAFGGLEYVTTSAPLGDGAGVPALLSVSTPRGPALRMPTNLVTGQLAALTVVALVSLAAGLLGTEWLAVRPITALVSTARQLASGDLRARTTIGPSPPEIRELASALDGMAAALDAQHDRLRDAETRYRVLVEQAMGGVYVITADRILYVNEAGARIFGYTPDEVIARLGPADVTHPDDRGLVARNVGLRLKGEQDAIRYTMRGLRKDGTSVHCEVFGRRVLYAGQPAILGTMMDVTEQLATEAALARSEARFRGIFDAAAIGVGVFTFDGQVVQCNPALCRILGYTPDELREVTLDRLMRPEDFRAGRASWQAVFNGTLTSYQTEQPFIRKDGSLGWGRTTLTALPREGDDPPCALGLLEDTSEQLVAHQELVRLRQAVNASGEIVFLTDPRGILTFVNAEFTRAYGWTADEVVGKMTPRILKSGEVAPETYAKFWSRLLERQVVVSEMVNQRRDGAQLIIEASTSPVLDEEGRIVGFLAIQRDITARKRVEHERARLAMAVQQANDAVVMTSTDSEIVYVNPAFERQTGRLAEELVGSKSDVLRLSAVDPALYDQMTDTVKAGGVWQGPFEFRRKDGAVYTVDLSVSPARDAQGAIKYFVAVAHDISEREALQAQLRQAQKLEAIGRLAGGVAHDFNNLLTVILGTAEILSDELIGRADLLELVEEIRGAGDRAAGLTRQLLAFGRKQVLDVRVLDLNQSITEVDKLLRRVLGEDVLVRTVPTPGLWPVRADPTQIEQVLVNLAVNARDAMPRGGTLRIETANATLDELYARQHPGVAPGDYVMVSVSDTGHGMTRETQAHIFEPFFTTKDRHKGTGLGLSTVFGIVKQSGGHIWVYSEVDRGTVFKIYLPRTSADAGTSDLADLGPASLLPTGTETIVLVEDEPGVRRLAGQILRECGYRVFEAGSGAEALAICEGESDRIELLLTDVVMPDVAGPDLYHEILAKRPGLKALFMSGYTDRQFASMRAGGRMPFLAKPFTRESLARAVRHVVDARSDGPADGG